MPNAVKGRRAAADDEDMLSLPVVRVPHVKVYFTVEEVKVKYVLEVALAGRHWRLEKSFSEIRELGDALPKGPALPPFRFTYWKTNSRWSKIEERRAALVQYFEAISAQGLYVFNQNTFSRFLRIPQNLYSLDERPPPPLYLDTAWWCSHEDMSLNLSGCGEALKPCSFAGMPETVWLCTPNSAVVREGAKGVRIYLPMSKRQPRYDSRLRVIENSIFYGWVANHGDSVPDTVDARTFMNHARNAVKRMLADRQWASVGGRNLTSSSSGFSGVLQSNQSGFSTCLSSVLSSYSASSEGHSPLLSSMTSFGRSGSGVEVAVPAPVDILVTPPDTPYVAPAASADPMSGGLAPPVVG
eukprot:TRINITY_DN2257_c0_g4_i1.p1 TRINITY_DN2257_c0_g4~~TRINITY_DN2257_c0_g4_i1.p1  ORF type:complete len:355 (+),score=126.23 TRINITY_DN2257_c0_g4_i1:46-1110(+)